jgi:hypothetical protein
MVASPAPRLTSHPARSHPRHFAKAVRPQPQAVRAKPHVMLGGQNEAKFRWSSQREQPKLLQNLKAVDAACSRAGKSSPALSTAARISRTGVRSTLQPAA